MTLGDDYCSCLTRTIHIYKEIADGLEIVLSSVKQENEYHTEIKNKLEKTLYSNTTCKFYFNFWCVFVVVILSC